MIPTVLVGPVLDMVQDTVYALPARQVRIMSNDVVQISLDDVTYQDVAASTTGADVTAVFVKCTTGDTVLVAKV